MFQPFNLRRFPLFLAIILLLATPTQLFSQSLTDDSNLPAQTGSTSALDWIEPRGVNVVDLVGAVPEEHLRGTIVRYVLGVGLAYYESGERNGDTVKVRLRYVSKYGNHIYCLGKPGEFDSWPSVAPASTLRIFENGVDATSKVDGAYSGFAAGQTKPRRNTNEIYRYEEIKNIVTERDNTGAVKVPANMGCIITASGINGTLTAEFTFNLPQTIAVNVLGSQAMKFRSYIGVGAAGCLESLRGQMQSRFGDRHDDLKLEVPAGTEFFLLKYPATPVDPYQYLGQCNNVPVAGGGTYRVRRSNAKLSVDHYSTMALPLYGQWQDADQSEGTTYLPHFTDSVAISSPEYFVPVGISHDPCMTNGGCPDSLLNAINVAQMDMTAYYYSIYRIGDGLEQIPLKSVGPNWSPGVVRTQSPISRGGEPQSEVFLPIIMQAKPLPPADDPTAGCPCGWFDSDGRMFDYVPGQ